jgi:hypothetical protein
MKNKTSHSRLDVPGNGNCQTAQEIFNSVLRRWWQRLGYCSIFAAVPAVLASQLDVTHSAEARRTEASVTGPDTKVRHQMTSAPGKRALLKRQSKFSLPNQSGSFDQTPLVGPDDCPGLAIPGGTYTSAAPYVVSGDTTGANDTVTRAYYIDYTYYNYDTSGPDHVYTFTLTGRGPNPQIVVSTMSGTYKPLIYILDGARGTCPSGNGNHAFNELVISGFWSPGSTATLEKGQMNFLPLNVPLHLVVDARNNDGGSAGPYTIKMQDVTIAPTPSPNQIDETQFFVRQHYRDFLSREADQEGLAFWANQITSCGGDQRCIEVNRINDSGAFFLSIEFQETGYLAYRIYKTAFGNLPNTPVPITFSEFIPDTQTIGRDVIVRQIGWEQVLENNKRAFTLQFVQRPRFTAVFPPTTSAREFVDKLNANAGNPLSEAERDQLISDLSGGRRSRAEVLRAIAENPKLVQAEFTRAFVLMQYFGYLRRNPNDAPDGNFVGYDFWLDKLNSFNGDFNRAEMVKAFLSSAEYRRRFGP